MWLLILALFGFNQLSATCSHSTDPVYNPLGPVERFVLNPRFTFDDAAISALAEAGERNLRLSGTGAFWIDGCNRFKATGEYLLQNMDWNFSTGKERRWVQQLALGGDWQYLIEMWALKAFDFKGFYTYAASRRLGKVHCASGGFDIDKRIAGTHTWGLVASSTLVLWKGSRLDLAANYDHINFRTNLQQEFKVRSGYGGSVAFYQELFNIAEIELHAEFRRIYNSYSGKLNFCNLPYFPDWTASLFATYTRGKLHLPSSSYFGLELAYSFSLNCREPNEGGWIPKVWSPCNLNTWVLTPAIYMPEVLAIVDECRGPTSHAIDDQIIPFGPYTLDVAALGGFATLSTVPFLFTATGLPFDARIDSVGVISGNNVNLSNEPITFIVTVTANDPCSATSQTFNLIYAPVGIVPFY